MKEKSLLASTKDVHFLYTDDLKGYRVSRPTDAVMTDWVFETKSPCLVCVSYHELFLFYVLNFLERFFCIVLAS